MNVKRKVFVLMAVLAGLGALSAKPAAAQRADLRVVTSVSPPSPVVGERLTYTHQVSFVSGTAATKVTLTDMLPTGATFNPAGSDSRCSVDTCGTTVVCTLDTLQGPASVTVAVIPTSAGLLKNVVGVAAEEYDPVMSNNSAVRWTQVSDGETYCIHGRVALDGEAFAGVNVSAGGRTETTDDRGEYHICGLADDLYTVRPALPGFSFSPESQSVTIDGGDHFGVDFTAFLNSQTFCIGGWVRKADKTGLGNAAVSIGDRPFSTNSNGWFRGCGFPVGIYTVVPTFPGWAFEPPSRDQEVQGEQDPLLISFLAEPLALASLDPASGATAGGTSVTLTGTAFLPDSRVAFDGIAAFPVEVLSKTRIRVTTPPHALAGLVPVAVIHPDGASTTREAAFNYTTPATNRFYPLTPCRAVDTRNADGPLGGPALSAGSPRAFDLRGQCGIPSTAQALEVNIAVVGPSAQGAIRISPVGITVSPDLIPFEAGVTRAQFLSVPLTGTTPGLFTVRAMPANATVHLVIDVFGYHAP